jgi:antitoxin component YwqK of YwqJK toxin-antitoxin module
MSFKDDKEDGKWIFYDEKGAVMTIRTYKEGEEISCSGKCD